MVFGPAGDRRFVWSGRPGRPISGPEALLRNIEYVRFVRLRRTSEGGSGPPVSVARGLRRWDPAPKQRTDRAVHIRVPLDLGWADLREDKMINPAPGVLADFRPLGAHGGPREPWDELRLEKIVQVAQTISPGDQL